MDLRNKPTRVWYKFIVLILIVFFPILPWLGMLPLGQRFANFSTTFRSLGQICSLLGFSLFAVNLILITRIKFLDKLFLGLDKVYKDHHNLGGIALVLLLFHPVFLATGLLPIAPKTSLSFFLPLELQRIDLLTGKTALFSMIILLAITFYTKLPYHIWKLTHKLLGFVFPIVMIHILFVNSDVSSNGLLKFYLFFLSFLAIAGFVYRAVLGRYVVKRKEYVIKTVTFFTEKILEIVFSPLNDKIQFNPGQFIYLKIPDISNEDHPFSIISSGNQNEFSLLIKKEGDYTNKLSKELKGKKALIEGPFGNFNYSHYVDKKQIWIAGGIGLAPFLSFAFDLENRKGNINIDLFYSVRDESELVYLKQLKEIEKLKTGFKIYPYISSKQGRLNVNFIRQFSNNCDSVIFICGPALMMSDLKKQFIQKGVSPKLINLEDFNYK